MRRFKYIGRNPYLLLHIPRLSEPYLFKKSEDYTCTVQDKDAEYMKVAFKGRLEEVLPEPAWYPCVFSDNDEEPQPELEEAPLPIITEELPSPPPPLKPLKPRIAKTIKKKPAKKVTAKRKPKTKEKVG